MAYRFNSRFGFEFEALSAPVEPRGRRIGGRQIRSAYTFGSDVRLVRINPGRSETSLALSVGGGVGFVCARVSPVGPNITFTKLFGSTDDIDLTRIGLRTTYRFLRLR